MSVRTVADVALIACSPDYEMLRLVLLEPKRRCHEPEPGKHPSGNGV